MSKIVMTSYIPYMAGHVLALMDKILNNKIGQRGGNNSRSLITALISVRVYAE